MGARCKYDWGSVDWTMQNCKIATMLGCDNAMVSLRRKKYWIPASPNKYHGIGLASDHAAKWDGFRKLDWARSDAEVARAAKLSRERVRQIRKKLGLAPSKRCDLFNQAVARITADPSLIAGLDLQQIGTKFEVAPSYRLQVALIRLGLIRWLHRNSKYPHHMMNFDLPNIDLTAIWKTGQAMVGMMRMRLGLQKARFYRKLDSVSPFTTKAEYDALIQAEKEKAARWKTMTWSERDATLRLNGPTP